MENGTIEDSDILVDEAFQLLASFHQFIETGLNDDARLAEFGAGFDELGMEEESREAFRRALRQAPERADYHYLLGASYSTSLAVALINNQSWPEIAELALESFEQALRLEPSHLDAMIGAIDCLMLVDDGKRIDEIIELCRRWWEFVQGDPIKEADAIFKLSIVYYLEGRNEDAENLVSLLLEKVPEVAEPFLVKGLISFKRGEHGFLETINVLRAIDPVLAQSLLNLSQLQTTIKYRDIACVLMSMEVEIVGKSG